MPQELVKPYFMTASEKVEALCMPLKKHFGITSFVFLRIYTNGSEIRLSNQPAWLEHFFKQELYKISNFQAHPDNFCSGFVLWSDLKDHDAILQEARYFNIDHGITLCNKQRDYVELCFFGTERGNAGIIPLYLSHLDLLERFTLYFKDRGKQLIAEAERYKICLDKNIRKLDQVKEQALIFSQNGFDRQAFLQDTVVHQLILPDHVALTKRELDCIAYLLAGYTAKESAERLFVSKRTIETHWENVKDKLQVATKSELIQKLRGYGFEGKIG